MLLMHIGSLGGQSEAGGGKLTSRAEAENARCWKAPANDLRAANIMADVINSIEAGGFWRRCGLLLLKLRHRR